MKTLIKKEIRLLLPAWIAAMLLAIAPGWLIEYFLPHQSAAIEFPPPFFVLPGLFLLGISAFGREFSAKTFSLLLSQPVVRIRAWRLKTLTLALAFALVLAAGTISWSFFIHLHPAYSPHFFDAFPGVLLWTVAIFTGGLWTTLLLRQEVGALWVTLLVPAAILAAAGLLADYLNLAEKIEYRVGDLAVLAYSAAGFLFARRLFLNAQDTQWTGGTFFFWRGVSGEKAGFFAARRARNRFMALLSKEIQLHDANLFIATIILGVNLGAVALRTLISNGNLKGSLEFVWALWLLMPLLIGCSAVAEERRLGVSEAQLCQPVSRWAALCIKFLVALVLSVILGAVLPSLIERTGNFGITDWPNFWIFFAAPAIFLVSFYASTLSRSTVHAIGVAVGVSVAGLFGFLICAAVAFHTDFGLRGSHYVYYEDVCRVYLMSHLCFLIFPWVLAYLMYWNFKRLHTGWMPFRRNAVTIFITFPTLIVLTNLIYFRSWELLFPLEAAYGPARLTIQSQPKILPFEGHGAPALTALLPDGSLWEQRLNPRTYAQYAFRYEPELATYRFVGSNWANISANNYSVLGIQKNGGLWRIPRSATISMTKIGSDTNWWQVAGFETGFILLKKDGSLWLWGTNQTPEINTKIKFDTATPPQRIGTDNNWTNVSSFAHTALARKNDGSYWSFQRTYSTNGNCISRMVLESNLNDVGISYCYWYNDFLEVKPNGQLWLYSQTDTNWLKGRLSNDGSWTEGGIWQYSKKVQLGSDSNWKAINFGFDSLILLRNDGTLWKWTGPPGRPFRPVRLGHYSDWVALGPEFGTALAADGSLWSWNAASERLWLAPSRKPIYMENIFEGTETGDQPATKTDTP
ncbi:MAG TPA: ABC transporter permease subunit [Candidatus Sulfotelmatobacter sp.]|nr:ABC transporter permease subunit [Candidatus Sulfotelmatobacter sp.]